MEEDFVPVLDDNELQDGIMKLVKFEGLPLLFIKQQGKIFIIDNRCPHQGCGFSAGTLDGMCIICPCHDWCFNLETGEYIVEPLMKLKKFDWKIEAGKIWVKLDE
jgi:nitrite reductase/ring-hydroxylating ferredoxin subunit